MARGRPRKPIEQKKLEGTYRKDRDAPVERKQAEMRAVEAIFPEGTRVSCPATVTDKYVRSYWKKLTGMLVAIKVLSPADIPQLEQLCVVLQKLREVQIMYANASPADDFNEFERIQKAYIALSNKFDQLGSKYYISPSARSKLVLDALNVEKTQQEITKNDSAISAILGARK